MKCYFNSLMVRLKAMTFLKSVYALTIFQFLNGSIKSCINRSTAFRILYFNSLMVRLKAWLASSLAWSTVISIP